MTTGMVIGRRARVEWMIDSPGLSQTLRVFYGKNVEGTVPDEELTETTAAASPGIIQYGTPNAVEVNADDDYDDFAYSLGTWIGPVPDAVSSAGSPTQDAQTSTASGTSAAPGNSGSAAVTQANQTSTASGVLVYSATSTASQANQTSSAVGAAPFIATAAATQAAQTSTASGLFGNFPGLIDGIEPETQCRMGVIQDSNGNLYRITESLLAENNQPKMMKSTDGGMVWTEQDAANRPGTSAGVVCDLESGHMTWDRVDKTITFTWQRSSNVAYSKFRTSDAASNPDTWTSNVRELYVTSTTATPQYTSHTSPQDQAYEWLFWGETTPKPQFRSRTNSSTLGSVTDVDSAGNYPAAVLLPNESDTFVVYKKSSQVHYKKLTSGGTLDSSSTRVDSSGTADAAGYSVPIAWPVAYTSPGGATVVSVCFVDVNEDIKVVDIVNGTPGSEQLVNTNPPAADVSDSTSLQALITMAVHDSVLHVIWADATTFDVLHSCRAYGGTWTSAKTLFNTNAPTEDIEWVSSAVVSAGGKSYLGYTYDLGPHLDDDSNVYYDRLEVTNASSTATQAAQTSTASGVLVYSATSTASQAAQTSTASGTNTSGISGSVAVTQDSNAGIGIWLNRFPQEVIIWGGTAGHPYTANSNGAGATITNDTTDVPSDLAGATQSIKMVTDGTSANNYVRVLNGPSMNFTNREPRIWIKVDNNARFLDGTLWLGSGGGLGSAYQWSLEPNDGTVPQYFSNEWMSITFPWSAATVVGTPNRAALTDVNFQVFDNSGGALTVWWGGISAIPDTTTRYPNGVVSLTFDDGFASHYTEAASYLQGKSFRGTSFIINDVIGTGAYMSTSQMAGLQSTYSWEVGLHSATAADHNTGGGFSSLTTAQIQANISANRHFLMRNGIANPTVFAWPQGLYDQQADDDLKAFVTRARTTKGVQLDTVPPGNRMRVYTRAVSAADSSGTITALIDKAVADQDWLVLLFHDIVASGATGNEVNQSTFRTIVDYCQTVSTTVLPFGEVLSTDPWTGASAQTQANQTSTASGTVVANAGTVTASQASQTSSASGILAYSATASVTQAAQTSTASGTFTVAGVTGTAAVTQAAQTTKTVGYTRWPMRGLSLMGAEFANEDHTAQSELNNDGITRFSGTNPGVHDDDYHYDSQDDYTYTDFSSMAYVAKRGIRLIRLPLRWERVQPTLEAALSSFAVTSITDVLDEAANNGVKVVLDIHNYGLYYYGSNGDRKVLGVDSEVDNGAFADLWGRMATAFAGHSALYGFGLMNEPQASDSNGLTASIWKSASQAAVDAIRAVDSDVMIWVGGFQWSDMYDWPAINGAAWITDPTGNFKYEAHHYWSNLNDGGYTTYASALDYSETDRGYTAGSNPDANYTRIFDDVSDWVNWLQTYNATGVVGEFGWPKDADNTGDPGDQNLWDALGDAWLTDLDERRIDAVVWGAGEFIDEASSDPLLAYQKVSAGAAPPGRLQTAHPSGLITEQHIEGASSGAVTQASQTSTASGVVVTFAASAADTQANQTSTASGTLGYSATSARTQASQTSTASATHTLPQVTVHWGEDLRRRYGVAAHVNFQTSSYKFVSTGGWIDMLADMSGYYFRSLYAHNLSNTPIATARARALGIKWLALVVPDDFSMSAATLTTRLNHLRDNADDVVIGIEGINEPNASGRPSDWAQKTIDYQKQIWDYVQANSELSGVTVVGPSLHATVGTAEQDHIDLANATPTGGGATGIQNYFHVAGLHRYSGARAPGYLIDERLGWIEDYWDDPDVWVTETGYTNAVNRPSGHNPISEAGSDAYAVRNVLEFLERPRIQKITRYEWLDDPDPELDDIESNFGLVRVDDVVDTAGWTFKPEFDTMEYFCESLYDNAGSYSPPSVGLVVTPEVGFGVEYYVTKTTSGPYIVWLYREDTTVWDIDTLEDIDVPEIDVEVRTQLPFGVQTIQVGGKAVPVPLVGDITNVTSNIPQADQTSSASGLLSSDGSSAATQASQTATASGVLVYSGSGATSQAQQTGAATGTLIYSGTSAQTQAAQTSTASGTLVVTGTAAATQANQTSTASSQLTFSGTAARTQAVQTSTASGLVYSRTFPAWQSSGYGSTTWAASSGTTHQLQIPATAGVNHLGVIVVGINGGAGNDITITTNTFGTWTRRYVTTLTGWGDTFAMQAVFTKELRNFEPGTFVTIQTGTGQQRGSASVHAFSDADNVNVFEGNTFVESTSAGQPTSLGIVSSTPCAVITTLTIDSITITATEPSGFTRRHTTATNFDRAEVAVKEGVGAATTSAQWTLSATNRNNPWGAALIGGITGGPIITSGAVTQQSQTVSATGQIGMPSFPGAEGFGTMTVGGRTGQLLFVTNTNDSGVGSLRAAVETTGPRIIVFRTGGTISLASPITITEPYCTIFGQTAPGSGILIRNDTITTGRSYSSIRIWTHDVIIRGLRVRPGTPNANPAQSNGITFESKLLGADDHATNIVVDHCSVSWANDENMTVWTQTIDATISYCLVSEGLSNNVHDQGEHSKAVILSGDDTERVSFHHNVLAHHTDRHPQPTGLQVGDIRNNVLYDYGTGSGTGVTLVSSSKGHPKVNWIKNYYKPGPDSDTSRNEISVFTGDQGPGWEIYANGNRRWTGTGDQDARVHSSATSSLVDTEFQADRVTTESAASAYSTVVNHAGAHAPGRDVVDKRIISDVQNGTGSIIDFPEDVGGYPTMTVGVYPTDTSNDGIPDGWKLFRGYDPNTNDSDTVLPSGYRMIEEYANSLFDGVGADAAVTQASQTGSASGSLANNVGTAAVTQASQTSTASGILGYTATATASQAAQTSSASGTYVLPTGTAAVTQASQTGSASGVLGYSATAAALDQNDTSTGLGFYGDGFFGLAFPVQASQTSTTSGILSYSGSAAASQASQASTASAQLGASGTLATTQANQTSTASGSVAGLVGTTAALQASQTSTASGFLSYSGTSAAQQASQTSAAAGFLVVSGTGAAAQDDQISSVSAFVGSGGLASPTQANQISTAVGVLVYTGTAAATAASQSSAAVGAVVFSATANAQQASQTSSATGIVGIVGFAAAQQQNQASSTAGKLVYFGAIAIVQANQTSVGIAFWGNDFLVWGSPTQGSDLATAVGVVSTFPSHGYKERFRHVDWFDVPGSVRFSDRSSRANVEYQDH